MKAKKRTAVIVLLSFLLIPLSSKAQFYKDMSVGINAGVYIYQGDLTPERVGSFGTLQPGFSLFVKKPLSQFLAVRFHMSFARLKGDDRRYRKPEYRQQRNFSFTSPVKEFSAQLVWNIRGRNYDDYGIMPYLFSGVGVALINVRKDYNMMDTLVFGKTSDVPAGLVIDIAKGTPSALFSVPVGIGAEYPISDRFSVNIETSYRFVFTDYLDGFSQSANPKKQDHYHSTSAGVIYKFGAKHKGIGCPVVKL